jgi:hypothetical protein
MSMKAERRIGDGLQKNGKSCSSLGASHNTMREGLSFPNIAILVDRESLVIPR